MSRRTRAVAVAVYACRLMPGSSWRRRPSCRYSGRKSCPHWLMQCASSTATKLTRHDGEQRQEPVAAVADEPLRRHVEQPVAPLAQAGDDGRLLVGGKRAVVERRRHAVADQGVDLVLHQRDQRRDDQRETGCDHGRRLEAERLAAARRQDDERIAAGEDRLHRVALKRPEGRVSPVACERGLQVRCAQRGTADYCTHRGSAWDSHPFG